MVQYGTLFSTKSTFGSTLLSKIRTGAVQKTVRCGTVLKVQFAGTKMLGLSSLYLLVMQAFPDYCVFIGKGAVDLLNKMKFVRNNPNCLCTRK